MTSPEEDPSSESLERGLRAGFGGVERQSVIPFLEQQTGSMLRLSLPDLETEGDPVVTTGGAESHQPGEGTRYAVYGEIARGGLGVVLKGRDLDLGRDVALKVLHERFKDSRQVIERFVEEAQIGGQLQHPGIVPVYEMGLQADDRPFFAMKLVKGQTLAEKLRRQAASDETPALLRIFLQVCQTVAYAHARRVVHRDLKPSNVMVGAFGEVQVVDWGLAKVMRRGGATGEMPDKKRERDVSVIETVRSTEGSSHSVAGSVMGTPAYMPPEQARGEVARMDERSDVFSLGALLCEILTGRPPYDSEDPAVALRQAADCDHEQALGDLETCGAEAELVALARACLSPAREARPADASEVAHRVEGSMHRVEERARRAEIKSAELKVKARSTLVIAAVVLLAVVLGGATWLSLANQRREHQQETADLANAELEQATRYSGQAEQAGLGGADLWVLALGAARRASQIVSAGESDDGLAARVDALVQDLERREHTTRAAVLRESSHELLLERIWEVRIGPDVIHFDWRRGPERRARESARRDAEYGKLFAEVGIDADSAEVPRASALFDCEHGEDFALALDTWAESRRVSAIEGAELPPESWRSLVRMARQLDPADPWRNTLRDELSRQELDGEGLKELARSATSEQEVAVVVALLDAAGELDAAIGAQLEGLQKFPSDYWLNLSLEHLCLDNELTGRKYNDHIDRAKTVAASLRPLSRRSRMALALGDAQPGLPVVQTLRALVHESPDDPVATTFLYISLMERGLFEEAADLLPDGLDALQTTDFDWDYHGFVTLLGHGERLLSSPMALESPIVGIPVLLELGQYERALKILQDHRGRGPARLPWRCLPVLDEARTTTELQEIHERLLSYGDADSQDLAELSVTELLAAAEVRETGWRDLVGAVRLYRLAFERDPAAKEGWRAGRARHDASFDAALASAGWTPGSESLSAAERRELRDRSRQWIHEELDVIVGDLSRQDLDREWLLRNSMELHQMQVYGWLAPIREPQYLASMEPEEAHLCRALWARILGVHSMLDAFMASEE